MTDSRTGVGNPLGQSKVDGSGQQLPLDVINGKSEAAWFRSLAEQGNAFAALKLGDCYWDGNGVIEDAGEAIMWFRRAAEQGSAYAAYKLGKLYRDGNWVSEDVGEAITWFRRAAEQGNACAAYSLGKLYSDGAHVEQDRRAAIRWFRQAADQGNADAAYTLAQMYLSDTSIEHDESVAMTWLRKAAAQGNGNAAYKLGECYLDGRGVQHNIAEAITWFRKAAEHGHENAQERVLFCEILGIITRNIDIEISGFYVYPKIPRKKCDNALIAYAEGHRLKRSCVVALYDATVFGSAKKGFLIRTDGLYSTGHKPKRWFEIRKIAPVSANHVIRVDAVADTISIDCVADSINLESLTNIVIAIQQSVSHWRNSHLLL